MSGYVRVSAGTASSVIDAGLGLAEKTSMTRGGMPKSFFSKQKTH
jgi:hypothetical protein